MKKIIPIIALVGTGILFGCSPSNNGTNNENLNTHIQDFQNEVENYSTKVVSSTLNTKLDKYNISLTTDNNLNKGIDNNKPTINNSISEAPDNVSTLSNDENTGNNQLNNDTINTNDNTKQNNDTSTNDENINNNQSNKNDEENNQISVNDNASNDIIPNENNESRDELTEQISTLYSLSNDIDNSCDEFCTLKENLTNAILETQNLIQKVQSNEITLTQEQKMIITDEARELKALAKQLNNITTELSINLSDIATILRDNNGDIDNLSLKYLIVLDNLVNGNEMIANGLNSLYMVNQMLPMNNGRILYGYRHNDEPPIIKDYTIENGEIKENIANENNNDTTDNSSTESNEEVKKGNIDTYLNNNFERNIDTYGNRYRNIDTFYNTALFNNELYGGMYGYPNMNYGYGNGYGNYANSNINNGYPTNTIPSVNSNAMPQYNENKEVKPMQEKKKFKLTSNIDTYRNEDTPTLSAKVTKIKGSISNFFSKFKSNQKVKSGEIEKLTENIKD